MSEDKKSPALPVRFYHLTILDNGVMLLKAGQYDAAKLRAGKTMHESSSVNVKKTATKPMYETLAKELLSLVKIAPDDQGDPVKNAERIDAARKAEGKSPMPSKSEGGENE